MTDTPSPTWVLKFISGKYQGGEFPLEEGKEYIVGRSSECDMVLVEDMVSRAHAAVSVSDGRVHLQDNNSTNGSFVNGERVNNAILNDGDRILFGTSIIKLIETDGSGVPLIASHAQAETGVTMPSIDPGQTVRNSRPTVSGLMSGMLDEVPLPDLLQLFATSRKTGILRIRGDRSASLHLREGRLVHCTIDATPDLDPEKAAYRALTWTSGMFVLEPWPDPQPFENEIEISTEAMMMEAMRLFDEMNHIDSDVPVDSVLTVKRPLGPPLRDLTPELLDTLQLIINYGLVETVLDHAEGSDLDVMREIENLLKNGYVERVG